MSVLLQHGYGPSEALLKLAAPFHERACRKHGWDYVTSFEPGLQHREGEGLGRDAYPKKAGDPPLIRWEGGLRFRLLKGLLSGLKDGDHCVWLDADTVWVDQSRPLSALSDGQHVGMVACPGVTYCTGAIYLRKTHEAMAWLDTCMELLALDPFWHLDLLATEAGRDLITRLNPEWNCWSSAIGELHCRPVVRAYHGEAHYIKLRGVTRLLEEITYA